jgi:hypothetical protein
MSSELNYPAPHAAAYTSFGSPIPLSPPARAGLLLGSFAAGAASITVTTVGGEIVVIPLGTTAVGNVPVYLPIQAAAINAAANVGVVVALWH